MSLLTVVTGADALAGDAVVDATEVAEGPGAAFSTAAVGLRVSCRNAGDARRGIVGWDSREPGGVNPQQVGKERHGVATGRDLAADVLAHLGLTELGALLGSHSDEVGLPDDRGIHRGREPVFERVAWHASVLPVVRLPWRLMVKLN